MSVWIAAPNGSLEKRRLRAMPGQLFHASGDLRHLDSLFASAGAQEDVHPAVLERLLSHRHAHRETDEVGVRELLPRPLIAVVEEYLEPCGFQCFRHLLAP